VHVLEIATHYTRRTESRSRRGSQCGSSRVRRLCWLEKTASSSREIVANGTCASDRIVHRDADGSVVHGRTIRTPTGRPADDPRRPPGSRRPASTSSRMHAGTSSARSFSPHREDPCFSRPNRGAGLRTAVRVAGVHGVAGSTRSARDSASTSWSRASSDGRLCVRRRRHEEPDRRSSSSSRPQDEIPRTRLDGLNASAEVKISSGCELGRRSRSGRTELGVQSGFCRERSVGCARRAEREVIVR